MASNLLIWLLLLGVLLGPVAVAATSPLLAWREPIYIAAGFAGIVAMVLLLVQLMLIAGRLPGLDGQRGRRAHGWLGAVIAATVIAHVAGLWITSPPDVIDAVLLVSPTPFSVWGVLAMWAIFATALLAAMRQRLRLRPRLWRLWHTALAAIVLLATVLHALLIEGTMGALSKVAFCALLLATAAKVFRDLRIWSKLRG